MKLLNNITGQQGYPQTDFSLRRDDNYLYFNFIAYDSNCHSYSNKDNDNLYDDNVVEIFLDDNDEYYYEIEVAPNGAKFIATILNRKITFIDDDLITTKAKIIENRYEVEIKIRISKFKDINKMRFNAYRIEYGETMTLLALSPTLCDTFHVRDKFIPLMDYLH